MINSIIDIRSHLLSVGCIVFAAWCFRFVFVIVSISAFSSFLFRSFFVGVIGILQGIENTFAYMWFIQLLLLFQSHRYHFCELMGFCISVTKHPAVHNTSVLYQSSMDCYGSLSLHGGSTSSEILLALCSMFNFPWQIVRVLRFQSYLTSVAVALA